MQNEPMRVMEKGWARRVASGFAIAMLATMVVTAYVRFLFPGYPGQTYPFVLAVVAGMAWRYGQRIAGTTLAMVVLGIDVMVLEGKGLAISKPEQAAGITVLLCVGAGAIWLTNRAKMQSSAHIARIAMLEEQLKARDEQLSELTHRVRNDLGTLSSLASLYGRKPGMGDVGLKSMGDRIMVLARLYQRLQIPTTGGAGAVEIATFLNEVATDLMDTHVDLRPISVEVRSEHVLLQMRAAAVIGLAVNEAITNALKYAWPNDQEGCIDIDFRQLDDDTMRLEIRDDGMGVSDGPAKGTGMGTRLMRSMAKQIRGTYSLTREDGWTIARLDFPIN